MTFPGDRILALFPAIETVVESSEEKITGRPELASTLSRKSSSPNDLIGKRGKSLVVFSSVPNQVMN